MFNHTLWKRWWEDQFENVDLSTIIDLKNKKRMTKERAVSLVSPSLEDMLNFLNDHKFDVVIRNLGIKGRPKWQISVNRREVKNERFSTINDSLCKAATHIILSFLNHRRGE